MLVEADIFQRFVGVLFVGGVVGIDQVLDLAALEQVLRHDLVNVLFLDAAVEGAVRIHDDDRAGFAQTKAARADDLDFFFKAVFLDLLVKAVDQFGRAGRRTAGAAADQHM